MDNVIMIGGTLLSRVFCRHADAARPTRVSFDLEALDRSGVRAVQCMF